MFRTPKEKQQQNRKNFDVFSVEEAAAVLDLPRRTLYRWEAAGKMPARIIIPAIGRKRKLYRRSEILAMSVQSSAAHD